MMVVASHTAGNRPSSLEHGLCHGKFAKHPNDGDASPHKYGFVASIKIFIMTCLKAGASCASAVLNTSALSRRCCLSIDACFRFKIRPLLFLVPAKVRLILVFESLQFFPLQILELIADYHSSVLILCAGEVVLLL